MDVTLPLDSVAVNGSDQEHDGYIPPADGIAEFKAITAMVKDENLWKALPPPPPPPHPPTGSRRLVVTADDLGYCPERNRAILECLARGVVSSTSLLVNAAYTREAVALIRDAHPGKTALQLPIGLHLNLTEGKPINESTHTLVAHDGFMRGKIGFRDAWKNSEITEEHVAMEIRSQIEKYKDLVGCYPLHIDGHQHVHIIPGVADIFARLLVEYGVTRTRLPHEPQLMPCVDYMLRAAPGGRPTARVKFLIAIDDNCKTARATFEKHGLRYADRFIGHGVMGPMMTVPRLAANMHVVFRVGDGESAARRPIACEMMVHPGYVAHPGVGGYGEAGPDEFARSEDRDDERRTLQSDALKEIIERYGIELSTASDL
ncbi:PREDICTED: carbohydrate deacetylase-like [Priapulus caudatus]|uniref:Carbohydrate deacetylase n=1 Tax=Priapulus caudatus TaxID=37621 RepID=A0ABM1ER74_PRICU|nr:PREDICTED: carbohydrate deacetylase-like [Priapulus caudatus]